MTLVGLLLIPSDDAIRADVARFGVERTVEIPRHRELEAIVRRAVNGASAIVFASPRRRWQDVMEAVRAAAIAAEGDVALRFYQPATTIDVRTRIFSDDERRGICVTVDEFEPGHGAAAYKLRRAVRDGLADLLSAEMQALRAEILDAEVAA